jgi:hypothetical protein
MPGIVYVHQAKKDAGYHPASFLHLHVNYMAGSRVLGRQHFYCFFRSGLGILHDRFC